jgi:hypothetical protein
MLINKGGQGSQLDQCFSVGLIYGAPQIMVFFVHLKSQRKTP